MEEVHNDHSETRKKLDDQSMEHKIAGKRQVRMIKDLKSHLKKEAKSKELLEEKLKSTTKVLARLQEEMANSVPVVAPQQPEKEDNKKTSTTRRPSTLAAMISQTVSGSTSSSAPKAVATLKNAPATGREPEPTADSWEDMWPLILLSQEKACASAHHDDSNDVPLPFVGVLMSCLQ